LLFAPLGSRELFLALVSDRLQLLALLSILLAHNNDVHIANHWLKVFSFLLMVLIGLFIPNAKLLNEPGELAPARLHFILLCAYFRLFFVVSCFILKLSFLVY